MVFYPLWWPFIMACTRWFLMRRHIVLKVIASWTGSQSHRIFFPTPRTLLIWIFWAWSCGLSSLAKMQWSHNQALIGKILCSFNKNVGLGIKNNFLWIICLGSQYINFVIEGKFSFNNRSLHAIGDTPNPYEKAISVIGKTLAPFDDDNLIPCFGFGDGMSSPLKLWPSGQIFLSFSNMITGFLFFYSDYTWSRSVQFSQWSFVLPWFWRSFGLL